MLLVHADVNVDKVQHAAAVEDLSEVTTGAILFSDYGPHYERHFRRVFGDDEDTIIETSVERKKARFSQQAVSFDEKYLRSKAGRVPRD
jgi:hypothetical protein